VKGTWFIGNGQYEADLEQKNRLGWTFCSQTNSERGIMPTRGFYFRGREFCFPGFGVWDPQKLREYKRRVHRKEIGFGLRVWGGCRTGTKLGERRFAR